MLQSSPTQRMQLKSPGLLVGDVVVAIDGQPVPHDADRRAWVAQQLVDAAASATGLRWLQAVNRSRRSE